MRKFMLEKHHSMHSALSDENRQNAAKSVTKSVTRRLDEIIAVRKADDYTDLSIALFESIEYEPPTLDAIAALSSFGVKVYLPVWKTDVGETVYQWRLFGKDRKQIVDTLPGDIDMIIVPALCVDKAGNRLGRGGGWYDRVLANIKKSVNVYALCYTYSILDSVTFEIDDHDITMNGVIEISLPDIC